MKKRNRTKEKIARRELRAKCKLMGICYSCCKQKAVEGKVLCEVCAERLRKSTNRRRRLLIDNGVCTGCRRSESLPDRQLCGGCTEKRAEKESSRYRRWRSEGLCGQCGKIEVVDVATCSGCSERVRGNREENIEHARSRYRKWYSGLRNEVMLAYGGYTCRCCGEAVKEFLQLDHIDNDGSAHRKRVGVASSFWGWLRRNGYPEGLQVLCANCNFGKRMNSGVCPHKGDFPLKRRDGTAFYENAKVEAFTAYGGFVCNCCGETKKQFLQIDHVENGGSAHRRELRKKRTTLFAWLRANGYPVGFQVLCASCNFGKRMNGGVCPHETMRLTGSNIR